MLYRLQMIKSICLVEMKLVTNFIVVVLEKVTLKPTVEHLSPTNKVKIKKE